MSAQSAPDPSTVTPRARLTARLGRVGVWSFALQASPAAGSRAAIAAYEALGARATWIPESIGSKEVFAHSAILLSGGERMAIATGIANIYARDPMAMANGARTLAEAYPDRFVLGLGVSHAPSVATRGHRYGKPVQTMRAYLDAMEQAVYAGPAPASPAPIVLAALGPRMLELSAERTAGAHSYFVPVEHTSFARENLGPDAFLAVEQAVVIDDDPTQARAVARAFCERYLLLPNYRNGLLRLGWTESDLDHGGTDAVIHAVVAQGSLEAVVARIRAHIDAGADHVCVQVRTADPTDLAVEQYRELFAALGGIV
jgi:probable F420-dependent oxidoreductase